MIFTPIVAIFLALGLSGPEAVCAEGLSHVAKSACCVSGMTCACHHDKLGSDSCHVTQAPSSDKSIPARTAHVPSPRLDVPLFTMTPVRARDLVSLPVAHRHESDVSPPLGGSSPQAILRLWPI